MQALRLILIAGAGSFVGGALRYATSIFICKPSSGFPLSTFLINIIGCLLIGVLYAYATLQPMSTESKVLLTAGFCGGLTTFSTFAVETLELLQNGNIAMFAAYLLLSVASGITAVWCGMQVVGLIISKI